MERSGERSWRMGLPASVTRRISPCRVETRIAAIVIDAGPGMPHTVIHRLFLYLDKMKMKTESDKKKQSCYESDEQERMDGMLSIPCLDLHHHLQNLPMNQPAL